MRIEAAGNKPKRIEEFVGRVNSGDDAVSIAKMTSPAGWVEPGQTPAFDEYTVVLSGSLRVETTDLSETDIARVKEGQPVNVTFDAIKGKTLTGKVARIAPMSSQGQVRDGGISSARAAASMPSRARRRTSVAASSERSSSS